MPGLPGTPGSPGYRGFRDNGAAHRNADAARERSRIDAQRRADEAARRQTQDADRLRRINDDNLRRSLKNFQDVTDRNRMFDKQRRDQEALNRRLRNQQTPQPRSPGGGIFGGIRQLFFGRQQPAAIHRDSSPEGLHRQAEAKVKAHEDAFAASLAGEDKEVAHNAKNIDHVAKLITDEVRGDIPLSLLLGWMDKESSGVVDHDEVALHPGNKQIEELDEVGPFCISGSERTEILHLKPADRQRLMDDAPFSIKQGVKLAKFYQHWLETNYKITTDSPAVWQLVKLCHKVGYPSVGRLLKRIGDDASTDTWHAIKVYVARQGGAISLPDLERVDVALYRGAQHEARVSAAH